MSTPFESKVYTALENGNSAAQALATAAEDGEGESELLRLAGIGMAIVQGDLNPADSPCVNPEHYFLNAEEDGLEHRGDH